MTQLSQRGSSLRGWCLLILVGVAGCGRQSEQAISPEVDLSQGRKTEILDRSKLTFPKGFPATFELLKPTWIGDPEDDVGVITWDTAGPVQSVRDHYIRVFKEMGLPVCVIKPRGMTGETYEVRAFDERQGLNLCVGVGSETPGSIVSCFIFSLPATKENWDQPE